MPAVAAVRPDAVFAPATWADLRRVSRWRGVWLVAHAWGSIALILALAVWLGPFSWPFAIALIGGRQLGLAILMHDAAHGLLHPNRALNNWLGQWASGVAVGSDLKAYRTYHLAHHRFTQQPEDPDLSLSAPFPTSRASLWRKVARDLSGRTFLKQRGAQLRIAVRGEGPLRSAFLRFVGFQLGLLALSLLLWGWTPFLLWLVSLATTFQLALRVRNIAEHACTATGPGDPFSHARTTRANWLERALVAPYWVNFHAEHHLFMGLPCYRLPAAHAALVKDGHAERLTIAPGYASVLRMVTAP